MLDSNEIRKRRQSENKNSLTKKPIRVVDWESYIPLGIGIAFILGLIITLGIVGAKIEEENRDACKSIGGEYKVVDKQMSGKVYIDVYGCVK